MKIIKDLYVYKQDLYNYLNTIIPNNEIDDIIQNSIVKIFIMDQSSKLKHKNLKSLLFTIAKNEAYYKYKYDIKTKEANLEFLEIVNDDDDHFFNNIELNLDDNDLSIQLLKKQCIGYSIKQLSKEFKLSEGAIKSRLKRIKGKLKKEYEEGRL